MSFENYLFPKFPAGKISTKKLLRTTESFHLTNVEGNPFGNKNGPESINLFLPLRLCQYFHFLHFLRVILNGHWSEFVQTSHIF